eukprot:1816658-Prymnesium_polylepis.1
MAAGNHAQFDGAGALRHPPYTYRVRRLRALFCSKNFLPVSQEQENLARPIRAMIWNKPRSLWRTWTGRWPPGGGVKQSRALKR